MTGLPQLAAFFMRQGSTIDDRLLLAIERRQHALRDVAPCIWQKIH